MWPLWGSFLTFFVRCINLFLSLERLHDCHMELVSLWESGQTLCYTAGSVLGFVLLIHTTKTYTHQIYVTGVLKAVFLQTMFFQNCLAEFLTKSLP